MSTPSRLRTRKNIQFQSEIVAISHFRESAPSRYGQRKRISSGFLQVDAAYDFFASIAPNVLLQADAAYDIAAPKSSCRGGMGEAQGDPPRHLRPASAGATLPNGVLDNFNHLSAILLIGETRARRSTGPPPPGALGTRKSSTKIAFSGATCVIPRGLEGSPL